MSTDLHSLLRYHLIDSILAEKGQVGLDELTEAVREMNPGQGITEKLLLDDIEKMKMPPSKGYSAPLEFKPGTHILFYRDPSFSILKLGLSETEKRILESVIQYLDFLKDHRDLHGMKGMIQKLVDTLQIRYESENLESPDFVSSELPPGFGGSKFIAPLIQAIRNRKVVRLYYLPFYEDKPYFINVHPYLLKEYRGRWYLIGLNDTKKEIRTYGLDRIWELSETDQLYIRKNFTSTDYFRNTVGVISPIGEPPEIRIEVTSHQAKYLITQPLHGSQYIVKEDDDYVIFSYRVHPTYEFKSMILAMGKDVRVLTPDSFKKEVIHELNNAILAYGRKS